MTYRSREAATSPIKDHMSEHKSVTKTVIPVAGLGTRFLPMTKAMPKEMLPVVDKPAIQYVVEESVTAGITDILMVTGRNKAALENHFDRHLELEQVLTDKGDHSRLATVHDTADLATVHYMRQGEALGLGHAVLCAKSHVGNQPFAILLPDDICDTGEPDEEHLLTEMLAVHAQYGGSVIGLMEVPASDIHMYGCAAVTPSGDDSNVIVNTLVEKPAPGTEPSNLAIIGRYILDPAVFKILENTAPSKNGEIQLTDALQTLANLPAEQGGGLRAVVFRGRRYDTGDKLSYLKAVVEVASRRADLGADFSAWLRSYAADLPQ
jgi:UTP--glucose-1-phosphate uridylyltransferase